MWRILSLFSVANIFATKSVISEFVRTEDRPMIPRFQIAEGRKPSGDARDASHGNDANHVNDDSLSAALARSLSAFVGAELYQLNALGFFVADVIAVAVAFAVLGTNGLASLAGESMNLFRRQHASLFQDLFLLG